MQSQRAPPYRRPPTNRRRAACEEVAFPTPPGTEPRHRRQVTGAVRPLDQLLVVDDPSRGHTAAYTASEAPVWGTGATKGER